MGKMLLLPRTGLHMSTTETMLLGVLNHQISQAFSKLSPGATHELVPCHPSHLVVIGFLEVNDGKELSNEVSIIVMAKLHQWQKPKLLTNFFGLPKYSGYLSICLMLMVCIGAKRTLFMPYISK
jgi:hypothetical protein